MNRLAKKDITRTCQGCQDELCWVKSLISEGEKLKTCHKLKGNNKWKSRICHKCHKRSASATIRIQKGLFIISIIILIFIRGVFKNKCF